jgi:hypothetical protein
LPRANFLPVRLAEGETVHSVSVFRNRRAEQAPEQPPAQALTIFGILRRIAAIPVGLVMGRRRAERAAAIETILGTAILGVAVAFVLASGILGYRESTHPAGGNTGWLVFRDAVELGAGIGACLGAVLHLLELAIEERAKARKKETYGDNF